MDDRDRALLAEIAERDRRWSGTLAAERPHGVIADRRELLRIVGEQEALLRERDTAAEDLADDAAAERARSGKWGA